MRHRATLFTVLLIPLTLPTASRAQERDIEVVGVEGRIEIVEPVQWRAVEPRGITVKQRTSIRVVGRASHPAGVNGVLINGDRAALRIAGGGGVQFTGYVKVEDGVEEVEVAAFTNDGKSFLRRFPMEPVDTEQVYEAPDEAFAADNGFRGKRWAVVVGISEYGDRRIPGLRFADRDARAFYEFLISERAGLGGFPEENVILLLNRDATYLNLRTALFSFLKEATEDDQVVIYFAGHGAPDPERLQSLYLLTYDTRADNLSGSAFPMEDVAEATRNILARDLLVITDACHSAGVGGQVALRDVSVNQINRAFLDDLSSSTGGLTIFTASQATQASHEGPQWGGGHGVFTYHMLEALNGAADTDRDRIVTLVEMMEYTRERVRRETRNAQIPSISQTAFDQALPLSVVLDPSVYARLEEDQARREEVALPSMFATPEPARSSVVRLDPTSALIRGFTLPGLGMYYVDRPGLGLGYFLGAPAAWGGAYLVMKKLEENWLDDNRDCVTFDKSGCDVPWYVEEINRAVVVPGIAAVAVWVAGAFHARSIAKSRNEEADALRRTSLDLGGAVRLDPPVVTSDAKGVRMELVRLRF